MTDRKINLIQQGSDLTLLRIIAGEVLTEVRLNNKELYDFVASGVQLLDSKNRHDVFNIMDYKHKLKIEEQQK